MDLAQSMFLKRLIVAFLTALISGWSAAQRRGHPDVTGHGSQIRKPWQLSSNNTGSEPDCQP